MITLRRMKALVMGDDLNEDHLRTQLEASAVPLTPADVDCRTCPDPCDEGHEAYPARFDVDRETQMLGSVKPYRRQVVISTGKIDWDREVTDTKGSLAHYLTQVQHKHQNPFGSPKAVFGSPPTDSNVPRRPPLEVSIANSHSAVSGSPPTETKTKRRMSASHHNGVFKASDSTRLSILNGSHNTLCADDHLETVLVFPDYKVVTEVSRTFEGAQSLWDVCVDPQLGREGAVVEKSPLNTWIIPYSCVILLCSHKKRDNRCSIAAAKLEHAFTQSLEAKGWLVDTQLEHPLHTHGLPLEEFHGTPEEHEENILQQLQELAGEKKALIIRNSHTGGHKYAGNCIIYTPQGSGIWYGRVSTHEVPSIVENTLEDGLVLPPLLRGGVNISRPGCRTLHDW